MSKLWRRSVESILLGVGLSLFSLQIAVGAEPPNLTLLKQQLKQYYHSGQYMQEVNHVIVQARNYLVKRLADLHALGKHPAIVLDIDETALSNYPMMERDQFCETSQQFESEVQRAHSCAIDPTLALYLFAKQHHIAVFFITARRESDRIATVRNLNRAHYQKWDGLILKANHDLRPSAAYKAAARRSLVEQGYQILANIGDQYSDLSGGYADQTFKLPNPYYAFS